MTLTGQDIAEAQGAVSALLDRILATEGVSSTEYVTMRVIAAGTQPRVKEYLATQRQLNLTPSGVDALFEGLERQGLVTQDAQLTDAGRKRFADLTAKVGEVTRELYAPFDPADLSVAHDVLRRVIDRASTLVPHTPS
jgi:DNA-binding MarR family transcriptional regulator